MQFVKFTKKGIYCIPGKFYIDPWYPVKYAVISHGHADHARWGHKHYLCHHHSKPILKLRIGDHINVQSLGYDEPLMINDVQITFFPAGHIIGSAQIKLEYKGYSVVFTGDFKTQKDDLTIPFQPVKCHSLITESTFGLPIYKWKSEKEIQKELIDWIVDNQQNNKTSVLFGYSLGKAQRIVKLLEHLDEIYVHQTIKKVNNAIESAGILLPKTNVIQSDFDKKTIQKKVIVLPPALQDSNLLKKIPNPATAICSGWMHIRGNKRWRNVDAGFPISDHADWDGLLQTVKDTGAEKVFVTHGYQAVLTKYLNEIGVEAQELKTEFGNEEISENEKELRF